MSPVPRLSPGHQASLCSLGTLLPAPSPRTPAKMLRSSFLSPRTSFPGLSSTHESNRPVWETGQEGRKLGRLRSPPCCHPQLQAAVSRAPGPRAGARRCTDGPEHARDPPASERSRAPPPHRDVQGPQAARKEAVQVREKEPGMEPDPVTAIGVLSAAMAGPEPPSDGSPGVMSSRRGPGQEGRAMGIPLRDKKWKPQQRKAKWGSGRGREGTE